MLLLDAFAFYMHDARFYLICRLCDMSLDASGTAFMTYMLLCCQLF